MHVTISAESDNRADPTSAALPQVDRRRSLSVREFNEEYRSPLKPVVITDAVEGWNARKTWTFDHFRVRYAKDPVKVYRFENGTYKPELMSAMPMGRFIDGLLGGDWTTFPYYIRDDWSFMQEHPELLADYREPEYFFDWFKLLPSFMRLIYPRLFIGPRGATTPLHIDIWETHAWLTQLAGRKRWLLFPPDQTDLLYGFKVCPDEPDFNRFPRYRDARPLECTIGPGDTIFVPSGWAHQVVSLDATISLSGNYMGPGCFGPSLHNVVREMLIKRLKGVLLKRFA